MQQATLAFLPAPALLCSADAQAQRRGEVEFTVILARHDVRGGLLDYRTGALLDVLAAGQVSTMPRWSLLAVSVQ